MNLLIGIDIGGTFTDIVGLHSDTGTLVVTKVPSTPKDFAQGFFEGLEKLLGMTRASPAGVKRLIHGTTVATNAIMEKKGAKIGILTTKGFEDVLIMGRQGRSENYNLFYDAQTPTFVCSRQNIIGIKERLDHTGKVLVALEDEDVISAVDFLVKRQGVQAIAVCYLFSFVDAIHEKRTAQLIHRRYPGLRVSLASTINPRFREYERMTITAFDAYVGPKMEEYIRGLEAGMRRRNIDVVLQVMQSRGGITSGAMCMERPVVTLLSGPAGGVAGGIFVGKMCGRENLITMDMGGTTNDVALVRHGKPYLSLDGKIDGHPLRQAMIDMTTIGAGGGSIARLDGAGGLKVGPQSAGSDPGPACYNRGGQEPTVTDSSVVLGYLNPKYFGAGELVLNPDLAEKAIEERIARPLGISVLEAAAGIQRIVNNNMADQIRLVSVYKGFHPRDFSLVAFGGAGPVAAGRLLPLVGMKEVIIPNSPGVLSAFGLLVADIEHEEVASFAVKASEVDPTVIMRLYDRLYDRCEEKRKGVGISETELHVHRSAEMRYVGQSYELEVPFPEGKSELTKGAIREVVRRFHDIHQSIYQHSSADSAVEFMAFRTVFSQKPKPMPTVRALTAGAMSGATRERKVYFEEYKEMIDTPVYERGALVPGQRLKGPAIIEQADTTTVLYLGQVAEVDNWGNLIVSGATV